MLDQKINDLFKEAMDELEKAQSFENAYKVKVKYLGKKGLLSLLMKDISQVSKDQRPELGKKLNEKKNLIEKAYAQKIPLIQLKEFEKKVEKEKLDLSLPGPEVSSGSLHPITKVTDEIIDILSRFGFSVRLGPCVESFWFNFEALNMKKDHPSTDEKDTFYVSEDHVLRTHTSPVQIRTMLEEKPPIRILAPGAVFRKDQDISHSPHFHQLEALLIDEKVSMSDLKALISYFVKEFFSKEIKTRFRPSFFPFTEPSAEVDCSCPICLQKGCFMCKNTGWIEIGGCGLVHPQVLKSGKLDPEKWKGFAFGFGIERMAIIKYQIPDIKLFLENDLRFLKSFLKGEL